MAGRVSKKNETLVINSTNVFAALDTSRKKKKSSKSQGSSEIKGPGSKNVNEKEVFWAPKQLNVKSWADVDDEDDDDYFATSVPVWGAAPAAVEEEESESGILGIEEADDTDDDEHEQEHEPETEDAPVEEKLFTIKTPEVSQPPKDPERQLSKKELKKKGLEELDAVLAELGYLKKESTARDESAGTTKGKKSDSHDGDVDVEKKGNAPAESKNAKKKKKKDKASKESKDQQNTDSGKGLDEVVETEKAEDTPAVDVKERLKRAATRKKKSSKDMDAAARAAATEAAARNSRLAAAKKKEKSHYYQQPVR